MLVFLAIDKEPPEGKVMVEKRFRKNMLYNVEDVGLFHSEALPTVF